MCLVFKHFGCSYHVTMKCLNSIKKYDCLNSNSVAWWLSKLWTIQLTASYNYLNNRLVQYSTLFEYLTISWGIQKIFTVHSDYLNTEQKVNNYIWMPKVFVPYLDESRYWVFSFRYPLFFPNMFRFLWINKKNFEEQHVRALNESNLQTISFFGETKNKWQQFEI